MEIEGTTFGAITIDGKTYAARRIIRLSGEVAKRKQKLSKKHYGTSHVLSKDEAKFVFERGCEQLILGSGQGAMCILSPEAEAYFAKKGLQGYYCWSNPNTGCDHSTTEPQRTKPALPKLKRARSAKRAVHHMVLRGKCGSVERPMGRTLLPKAWIWPFMFHPLGRFAAGRRDPKD